MKGAGSHKASLLDSGGTRGTRDRHLRHDRGCLAEFPPRGVFNLRRAGTPKVLMAAGHGYGNLGDEAQCGACIERWRRVVPNAQITVFSPNPAYTEALHGERCEWAPRVAWFRSNTIGPYFGKAAGFGHFYFALKTRILLSAWCIRLGIPFLFCRPREATILHLLMEHDLLHVSGGGFLTGKTRTRLWENCLLMQAARILKVPYILTGQTIGVFQSSTDRRLALSGLRSAAYIGLRDAGISERELRGIGLPSHLLHSTCDDALLCKRAGWARVEKVLVEAGVNPDEPWVSINFHDWKQAPEKKNRVAADFAGLCDYLVKERQLQAVFIAMTPKDVGPEARVRELMKESSRMIPYDPDYKLVRGIIAESKLCFTMKHHPIVFAQGEVVPVVAVALDEYYMHKNLGALKNSGQGDFLITKDVLGSESGKKILDRALDDVDLCADALSDWKSKMQDEELDIYREMSGNFR